MKPFRFSLQAILTLRREQEQEAQRQCAERLRAISALQTRLASVATELATLAAHHQAESAGGIAATALQHRDQYRRQLDQRERHLQAELAAARQAAAGARQVLVRATQSREALDKYRERARRLHAYAGARAEQRGLDDRSGRDAALASSRRQLPEKDLP